MALVEVLSRGRAFRQGSQEAREEQDRWIRSLSDVELASVENAAIFALEELDTSLADFSGLEDEEFDEEPAYLWKLLECLADREAVEGLRILLKRRARGATLELYASSVDSRREKQVEHYRSLLVPHLERIDTQASATVRRTFQLDPEVWWGAFPEEDYAEWVLAVLEAEAA
jgi:hypothetical protein